MINFSCEVRNDFYLSENIKEGQKLHVHDHADKIGEEEYLRET